MFQVVIIFVGKLKILDLLFLEKLFGAGIERPSYQISIHKVLTIL